MTLLKQAYLSYWFNYLEQTINIHFYFLRSVAILKAGKQCINIKKISFVMLINCENYILLNEIEWGKPVVLVAWMLSFWKLLMFILGFYLTETTQRILRLLPCNPIRHPAAIYLLAYSFFFLLILSLWRIWAHS